MPLLIVKERGKELRRFSFKGDIITIGRDHNDSSGGTDLTLRDMTRKVSRYHAAIIRDRRGFYFIRDLSSANGTLVNDRLVFGKRLYEGDRIGIGDFDILFYERRQMPPDLSQAIRITTSAPPHDIGSDRTILDEAVDDAVERLPEARRQILHDIVHRLRSMPDKGIFHEELLCYAAPALNARRGMLAVVEMPFTVLPKAVYGIDIDHGEQMTLSGDFLQRATVGSVAQSEFFAGIAVICCPLQFDSDRRGFIYLEGRRGANFSEEDRAFLELLCNQAGRYVVDSSSEETVIEMEEVERFEWETFMVAKSPEMKQVTAEIDICADIASNVMICGETGTGKEISARSIHARSARSSGPFVPVELSNLEREMVSSVLFGWKKGSFTGADRDSEGAFEKANGGTIYLDEIGDINHDVQIKLRRVVEEKELTPVGSVTPRVVDVKVIAATNIDMDRALAEKKFRDDLLQRFGKRLILPPLKGRQVDIPLLVCFFIDQANSPLKALSHGAMRLLQKYPWPGNVRELRELIRDLAGRNKEIIFGFDLPEEIQSSGTEDRQAGLMTMQETEKQEIIKVLRMTGWNKAKAWKILGYGSKQTLYNKITKYQIENPDDSPGD